MNKNPTAIEVLQTISEKAIPNRSGGEAHKWQNIPWYVVSVEQIEEVTKVIIQFGERKVEYY